MRKILYLIICMPLLLFSACDVHEWPETPEFVKMHLRLNYETDMTEWEHLYDGAEVIEQGYGETYDNHRDYGKIRYIVRTYPVSEKMRTTSDYTQEFVFTKDISEGYDHEVTLDLLPGNYNVMVWSDLVQTSGDSHFYNADNFAEIRLQGDHKGNNDYRDALTQNGMLLSGLSPDGRIVEMVEIPEHPWFIGTQAHPELKSRPNKPHPLFKGFVEASLEYSKEN